MPSSSTSLLQGTLDVLILKVLTLQPMHGLGISRRIAQVTGETFQVKPGSLFPALHRMEEAGWIRAEWVRKGTGRRARLYELTAAGKKQLGMEESRWQAVTLAVNRVLREA